jgi:hypothetical protein
MAGITLLVHCNNTSYGTRYLHRIPSRQTRERSSLQPRPDTLRRLFSLVSKEYWEVLSVGVTWPDAEVDYTPPYQVWHFALPHVPFLFWRHNGRYSDYFWDVEFRQGPMTTKSNISKSFVRDLQVYGGRNLKEETTWRHRNGWDVNIISHRKVSLQSWWHHTNSYNIYFSINSSIQVANHNYVLEDKNLVQNSARRKNTSLRGTEFFGRIL